MFQIQKTLAAAGLLGIVFAGYASAAEDAAQIAHPIAIPYRAESALENFSADASQVVIEQRMDGSRSYHLNGQGMQSMTAQIGADGKLRMQCSDDADKSLTTGRSVENANEQ